MIRFRTLRTLFTKKHHDHSAEREKRLLGTLAHSRIPRVRQLKYIGKFFSPGERTIIRTLASIGTVSLLLLVGNIAFSEGLSPAYGGIFREGVVGYPHYINPVLATANNVDMDLTRLIYRSLYMWDENGTLVPDVAKSLELRDEEKTYVIILRDDILWPDKERFTADDVVYTYQTAQDYRYGSPLRQQFTNVRIEKINDFEVQFHLKEPFVGFRELLTLGILPEHLWAGIPPEGFLTTPLNTRPVGNGPFLFTELKKDSRGKIKSFRITKNELYTDTMPYLDEIEFLFYDSDDECMAALMKNTIDGTKHIPQHDSEKIRTLSTFSVLPIEYPQNVGLFLNQQQSPLLRQRKFRSALELSIDRSDLVTNVLSGAGTPLRTPFVRSHIGFNQELQQFPPDTLAAQSTLDDLGWKIGATSIREKDNILLHLTISTVDTPELMDTAVFIQKSWKDIGIATDIERIASPAELRTIITQRRYEILLIGQTIGIDPDPFYFWHSSQTNQGSNISNYANRDVDGIIEEARKISTADRRAILYQDFQKKFIDDLPAILLYTPNYYYVINKKIKGVSTHLINDESGRFASIRKWYIKTKRL